MKTSVVKWGNSLAIRIPKPVAGKAKLKQGDSLEIDAAGEGRVELHRVTRIPSLSELVAQITPENRYSEVASDTVGKEVVEW